MLPNAGLSFQKPSIHAGFRRFCNHSHSISSCEKLFNKVYLGGKSGMFRKEYRKIRSLFAGKNHNFFLLTPHQCFLISISLLVIYQQRKGEKRKRQQKHKFLLIRPYSSLCLRFAYQVYRNITRQLKSLLRPPNGLQEKFKKCRG